MSQKTDALFNQVILEVHRNNPRLTLPENCLGFALSRFFGFDGTSILRTCYAALEDGNFHKDNEVIQMLIEGKDPR